MPKHTFDFLEELVSRVRSERITRWADIEDEFIRGIEQFDSAFASGAEEGGWYQSKARYFNDLIVGLLSNSSHHPISLRCKRRSRLFDLIDIDICFPESGTPIVAGEVKALGTPPHPKNKDKARPACQDLHKRAREVAFTSMDLKAEYAPPTPMKSFQNWVDVTSPGYFSFWSMRAKDNVDFEKVRTTLSSLRAYCNGVGAVIYAPTTSPTTYEVKKVSELSIDKCLKEMAQRIA